MLNVFSKIRYDQFMNNRPVSQPSHREKLALARKIALLMDSAFEIPGTGQRIGLDPLLGLVPGLGDLVSMGISMYIIYLGRQMGLPKWRLSQMLFNVVVDTVVGSLPVLGDTFDVFWKSNMMNLRIMEKHLDKMQGVRGSSSRGRGRTSATVPLPAGEQTIDVAAEPPQSDTF